MPPPEPAAAFVQKWAGVSGSERAMLIHEHGLVGVLRSLHDDLDAAVLQAYGWADLRPALADHRPAAAEARVAAVETLLERLVALNARRAAEEAAGTVRWLRPEFQTRARQGEQAAIEAETQAEDAAPQAVPPPGPPRAFVKRLWPAGLAEQIKAVAEVMAGAGRPLAMADLEARFSGRGRWRERLPTIVEALFALGRLRAVNEAASAWEAV